MKTLIPLVFLSMLTTLPQAFGADALKAFPPPEPGMVRYVLHLPEQEDETAARVELQVGRTVAVDTENTYFFVGKIEPKTIEGWGYTRYLVHTLGPMAGTLIAVDPAAPKVDRFVRLGGEAYLIPYNSRLPIVVYVPEGAEVRYRLWRAGPRAQTMEPG